MSDWSKLSAALRSTEGDVTLTWVQLDELVKGLPPAATKHRAWWSGNRSHVRSWRAAGYRVGNLEPGVLVTFVRAETSPAGAHGSAANAPAEPPPSLACSPRADILLVTCVKTKLDRPAAAKDPYTSPLFLKQRTSAEASGAPWFTLSDEHALVAQTNAGSLRALPARSAQHVSILMDVVGCRTSRASHGSTR